MLNVKMRTRFLFHFIIVIIIIFFTEWKKKDLLAAFSMHPTTSTTRTCRGFGVERRGGR